MISSRYVINNAADALDAAAEELEINGWCQGTYQEPDTGELCILGSIYKATLNEATAIYKINARGTPEFALALAAREALFNHLGSYVSTWNDKSCKTQEEAIDKLRNVAKTLREKDDN